MLFPNKSFSYPFSYQFILADLIIFRISTNIYQACFELIGQIIVAKT